MAEAVTRVASELLGHPEAIKPIFFSHTFEQLEGALKWRVERSETPSLPVGELGLLKVEMEAIQLRQNELQTLSHIEDREVLRTERAARQKQVAYYTTMSPKPKDADVKLGSLQRELEALDEADSRIQFSAMTRDELKTAKAACQNGLKDKAKASEHPSLRKQLRIIQETLKEKFKTKKEKAATEAKTTGFFIHFNLNHAEHLSPNPHRRMMYQGKSWYVGGGFTDFVDSEASNNLYLESTTYRSEGIHYLHWTRKNELQRERERNPQTIVVRSLYETGRTYFGLSTRVTEGLRNIQLGFTNAEGGRPFDHIQWYPVATKGFFSLMKLGYPLGSLFVPKDWTQIMYAERAPGGIPKNLLVPGPEPIDLESIDQELFWNTDVFKREDIKILLSDIFVALLNKDIKRTDVVSEVGLTMRDKLKMWEAAHTLLLNTPAYKPDFPINFYADPLPCSQGLVFRMPDEPMVGDYANYKSRVIRFSGQPMNRLSEQVTKNLDSIFVCGTWTEAIRKWEEFAKTIQT